MDSALWNGSTQIELIDTTADNLLVVGESFAIEFDVEIDPSEAAGSVSNQIEGSGAAVDSSGNPLRDSSGNQLVGSDLSDSGTDPGTDNPSDASDAGTSDDATQFTPPAAPLSEISGFVYLDENGNGIRDLGEEGIEGVAITLTGQDVFGNFVDQTVFTDASGQFVFSGLNAGTYTLQETQPSRFVDGLETAVPNSIVGDDVISNIALGFGETLTNFGFGERLTGTSGFPPTFPSITPSFSGRLSNLINGFVSSPSPIYSGVPIASNASPLSLDSNREVSGGFVLTPEQEPVDCGCSETIDPCGESIDPSGVIAAPFVNAPTEEAAEDCGLQPNAIVGDSGEPIIVETSTDCFVKMPVSLDESGQNDSAAEAQECEPCRKPFLKRFSNWLSR